MSPVIVAVISVLVGFVAGALLSSALVSEARLVEGKLKSALIAVRNEAEAKRAQLEKDVRESFKTAEDDVEAVVKRLEVIENNQAQRVAHILSPDAPRA